MAELEGLGVSFGGGRVSALGGSQEPEEGDDDEVDDVGVEGSMLRVVEVEGVNEPSQDGDVGWAGSACGVVVALEGFEERSEWGMELFGSKAFPWVVLTQVGNALAHGQ